MEEKKEDVVSIKEQTDSSKNENYIKLSIDEYTALIRENATLKKDVDSTNSTIKVVSHHQENKQTEEKQKRRLF